MPRERRISTGTVRLVVVPILIGLPLAALSVPAAHAGFAAADLAAQWLLYLAWGWWAVRTADALHIERRGLFRHPVSPRLWQYALLAIPLITLCLSALFFQMSTLTLVFPAIGDALLEASAEPTVPVVIAVLTGITGATLAPVVEELVFRGVLFRAWSVRFGYRGALIGTSLLFGVLHHDMIGSVIFGMVMVVLYQRTGSLAVPIVTHALYNAITQLVSTGPDSESLTLADLRVALFPSLLGLAVSLAIIVIVLRTHRPEIAVSLPPNPSRS